MRSELSIGRDHIADRQRASPNTGQLGQMIGRYAVAYNTSRSGVSQEAPIVVTWVEIRMSRMDSASHAEGRTVGRGLIRQLFSSP
jgi:hypothetical protein